MKQHYRSESHLPFKTVLVNNVLTCNHTVPRSKTTIPVFRFKFSTTVIVNFPAKLPLTGVSQLESPGGHQVAASKLLHDARMHPAIITFRPRVAILAVSGYMYRIATFEIPEEWYLSYF